MRPLFHTHEPVLACEAQIMGRMQTNQSKQAVCPVCAMAATQIHLPRGQQDPGQSICLQSMSGEYEQEKNKHHVVFRRMLTVLCLIK